MGIEKLIFEEIRNYFINERNVKLNISHGLGYGGNKIFVYPPNFFKCNINKWNKKEIDNHSYLYKLDIGSKITRRKYHKWIFEHMQSIIVDNLIKYNIDNIEVVFKKTIDSGEKSEDIITVYADGDYEWK